MPAPFLRDNECPAVLWVFECLIPGWGLLCSPASHRTTPDHRTSGSAYVLDHCQCTGIVFFEFVPLFKFLCEIYQ